MDGTRCAAIMNMFADLEQFDKIMAEYVWIGGNVTDMRSKTRTLDYVPTSPKDLPEWNYDGSSTGQAPTSSSEVILKPVAIYRDPFRKGNNILVLCDTYRPDGTPTFTNHRSAALQVFEKALDAKPWYGLEQEFTLFYKDDLKRPLGWPKGGFPGPQGPYYCSVGADRSFGRAVSDAHYKACLYAGINISGTNAEVMPGQWEYQIGPCEGISAGDQMAMSRYLLHRVCELFDVVASFDPKPVVGWNGAGCHVNFSTEEMRRDGGIKGIYDAVARLKDRHLDHIKVYGEGNDRRLTGLHETSKLTEFSYGVANRAASIRIPSSVDIEGKGYLEDRRPASNIDPYQVTSIICETVCL